VVAGSFRGRAEEKGVEFTVEAAPGTEVFGDQVQLSQIVSNLVDNALAYTQAGSVAVRLSDAGEGAELTVADTGSGIASEHIPRIFERFYRADKARSRETGGTGLGLSIVRNIVEAHGGTIRVESELNRGSTFTVRLPKHPD
jgi:signal transduction histidine kinase